MKFLKIIKKSFLNIAHRGILNSKFSHPHYSYSSNNIMSLVGTDSKLKIGDLNHRYSRVMPKMLTLR